jgi:integrase
VGLCRTNYAIRAGASPTHFVPISADANVKAVQTLLGQASAVMTLDLYGHLLSDDLTKVAEGLDRAARRTAA